MEKHRRQALAALATIGLVAIACGGADAGSSAAATAAATEAPATPAPVITPDPTATPEPTPTAEAATTSEAASTSLSAGSVGDPVVAPPLEGLVLPDRTEFEMASLQGEPVLIYFG